MYLLVAWQLVRLSRRRIYSLVCFYSGGFIFALNFIEECFFPSLCVCRLPKVHTRTLLMYVHLLYSLCFKVPQ